MQWNALQNSLDYESRKSRGGMRECIRLASDAMENDVESETKKVQIWQKEIQGLLIEIWRAGDPQVQGRVHKV